MFSKTFRISNFTVTILLGAAALQACGRSADPGSPADAGAGAAGANAPNPYAHYNNAAGQELNFATLINNYHDGTPDHQPWANTYWPYNSFSKNGIATTDYSHGSESPAAKYDKAYGCGSKSEAWEKVYHSPSPPNLKPVPVAGWYGHCNGWSASASLFPEPPESMVVNGVTFSRADMKALMTEVGMLVDADYFGHPVQQFSANDQRTIDDIYPDQFFLVLTNYMGIHKYGVNIDRYTGDEIWNQPLIAYRMDYPKRADYLGEDPNHPGVYRMQLTTHLWWGDDSADPNDVTPDFNYEYQAPYIEGRDFQSEVWLDGPVVFDANDQIVSSGNIVIVPQAGAPSGTSWYLGGTWLGQAADDSVDGHPDFMWVPYSYLDASDTTENGPNAKLDANPFVDHTWVIDHFYKGAADDLGTHPCSSLNQGPLPDPAPMPSATPTSHPLPEPTFEPFPEPTSDPEPIRGGHHP
jgi:hypothetical protein